MDLSVRYEEQLSLARQFLSASGRAKNGSSINDGRELTLLKNRAQCPHCGILFEGGNHNTEHIHPRALGGENTDSNRIQFCLACNNARNLVMQTILGHPPYFKNYPQNWPMVEEYLLWSEVSIDDGLSAGSQVDSIHQKFLMYRFSGHHSPTQIVNAYGRFSSWKKGDSPNYTFGNRQGLTRKQMVPQNTRTKGIFITVLDRLFGYDTDQESSNVTTRTAIHQYQTEQKSTLPDREAELLHQHNGDSQSKPDLRPMAEFRSVILSFLSSTPITISHLGDHVKDYMSLQGMSNSTTTDFLNLYGLPKGLKKALRTHLSEELIISGSPPSSQVAISPFKADNTEHIKPTGIKQLNEINHRPMSEFRSVIQSFLSTEPLLIAQLAKKIEAYMKNQGLPETTTTRFLKLYGLPRGLKKAISAHLSDTVIISGEVKKESVSLVSSQTSEEE